MLELTPQTCVVNKKGICETTMKIVFDHQQVEPLCIEIIKANFRECCNKSHQHHSEITLATAQTLDVNLVSNATQEVISSKQLVLAAYRPKKSRQRRTFTWSF